jgi:hypothetical protein
MKTRRNIRRIHNVLGVVVGVQVLLWMLSGLFFTLFPIEQVRGSNLRQDIAHGTLDVAAISLTASEAANLAGITPDQAELAMLLGVPVWKFEADDTHHLVDARLGDLLSPISSATARQIAVLGIKPNVGVPLEPTLLEANPPREYAGPLPAWVITYENTTTKIYIDAQTGDLRTVRTRLWRTFDVLWRFHIMDVTGKDRFDTWWLKLISFFGLTIALTGLVLGIERLLKGRLLR